MRYLIPVVILAAVATVGASAAPLTATSASPGNTVATGSGTWFSGNGVGTTLCAGTNASLSCPFGSQTVVGKVVATIAIQNKAAATTYTLGIVDGGGPAGISTIVTATFASNAGVAVTLSAGATDAIDLVVKLKGSTPAGSYTGSLVIADTVSGQSVAIPLSVTH